MVLGIVFTIIFHAVIKENSKDDVVESKKQLSAQGGHSNSTSTDNMVSTFGWINWLKEHQFYLVSVL